MRRLLPQTLFGQTLSVLLIGIGLSLAAGAWIYASARQEAVRAVGALAAAERIINLSRLVGEAPAAWRTRLVEGASDPMFRVMLADSRPAIAGVDGVDDPASVIADYIRQALPERTVVVAVAAGPGGRLRQWPGYGGYGSASRSWSGIGPGAHGGMRVGPIEHGPMMRGPLAMASMSWRSLDAAVEISDGQWLRFTTSLPDAGPTISSRLWLALAVMATMIALLTAWSVRRMTAPVRLLADAALRLGRNVDAPALVTSGTVEMRHAATAFNDMQCRLRRLIDNRTLMLAAISHDLRTQLTLLRLRAEAGEASEDRERMLRTIAEMEDILAATLSFAREDAIGEERRRIDVSTLVTSIVDDFADAGLPVATTHVATGVVADCKPVALRRAITNLVDNAVKYGSRATVGLSTGTSTLNIIIDDEGPGIPEDQLAHVMQPFYRLEGSRNRDTGGIGLGLAIAASIADIHGGTLVLANRPEGGLRATLALPL